MSDLDRETRAAVDALVHRLRNPGDTDPLGADAEPFAEEYVAAMKSRGWRPFLTPPPEADWRRASGGGRGPDPERPGGAAFLAAKAAIAARATGPLARLAEDDDRRDG